MAKSGNTSKRGSETIEIWRHELSFNPSNIKRHSDREIKLQVKNIRKNGYLGGIVYNVQSHALVDGHRRVAALDIIHKYNVETQENDYKIKVEQVDFDEKTEKEQLAFMALGNSKADYNLVAHIINDIDYRDAGITEEDYQRIREISAVEVPEVGMSSLDDPFLAPYQPMVELDDSDEKTVDDIIKEHEEKPKMTKEQVKAEKRKCDDVAANRQEEQDNYIFLKFDNNETKFTFCELMGVAPTNSMLLSGEAVLALINP